jgi:hypothetical protein
MDLTEKEWEGVDWIHLTQEGTSGGLCEHGNEPSGYLKGREFLEYLSSY